MPQLYSRNLLQVFLGIPELPELSQPALPGTILAEGGRKRGGDRSSSEDEEEGEVRSRMDVGGGKKGKGEHADAVPCHNVRRCGQV